MKQIIENPEKVIQTISKLSAPHALKFVDFYRTTKAYQAITQRQNDGQEHVLTAAEIICNALVTNNIEQIKSGELQRAIAKMAAKLDKNMLANLNIMLTAIQYSEAPKSTTSREIFINASNILKKLRDQLLARKNNQYLNLEKITLRTAYLKSKVSDDVVEQATNLNGVNLRYADLSGAVLSNATVIGADLSHANIENTHLENVDLTKANTTNTIGIQPNALIDGP